MRRVRLWTIIPPSSNPSKDKWKGKRAFSNSHEISFPTPSLSLSILVSSFVAVVSLSFVQFVALCFKRPFTSSFFSFHDYYDPILPRKSNYFPLDPLALFFFRANFEHPRLLCELKPGSTYRRSHEKLESFLVVSNVDRNLKGSLIPCTVNDIVARFLVTGISFGM